MSDLVETIRAATEDVHDDAEAVVKASVIRALLAEVDKARGELAHANRELGVLRAMKVQPAPPAPVQFDVRTNQWHTKEDES